MDKKEKDKRYLKKFEIVGNVVYCFPLRKWRNLV
jgi:hypothetical protein